MDLKDIKILIVDDVRSMRAMMKSSFKDLGFSDFIESKDGFEAIKILEKFKSIGNSFGGIALIVADWNMPVKNGLDLLKDVRHSKDLGDIPFLMITAESDKSKILEAVRFGVSEYIVKPFDTNTIKKKLENIFQEKIKAKAY